MAKEFSSPRAQAFLEAASILRDDPERGPKGEAAAVLMEVLAGEAEKAFKVVDAEHMQVPVGPPVMANPSQLIRQEEWDLAAHQAMKRLTYPLNDLISPLYGPDGRYGRAQDPKNPNHWRDYAKTRLREEGFTEGWISEVEAWRDRSSTSPSPFLPSPTALYREKCVVNEHEFVTNTASDGPRTYCRKCGAWG